MLSGGRRSASCSAACSRGGTTIDVLINALEQKGLVAQPGRAEPGRACPATPQASSPAANIPIPVSGALSTDHGRVQEIRRRPRLHADRAARRPDQPEDRAGGQPARSEPPVRSAPACVDPGADRAPRRHHDRAARRPELRDRRPVAEQEHQTRNRAGSVARQTCRCSARCSPAGRTRRTRPTSPSSSRRASCGRRGRATSIKTPLDNTLPANDVDFFLMGKAEVSRGGSARWRPVVSAAVHGSHPRSAEGEAPMSSQSRTRTALRCGARRRSAACSPAARTSTSTGAKPSRSAPATQSRPTRSRRWSIPGRATVGNNEHRLQRPAHAGGGRALPHQPGVSRRSTCTDDLDDAVAGAGARRRPPTPPQPATRSDGGARGRGQTRDGAVIGEGQREQYDANWPVHIVRS